MKGGEVLVETLIAHGVDIGFTVSGESFLHVLDALRRHSDRFRLVPTRQEGGAAFAAEAFAKISGRPAAVFVSRGPGSSNAAIGVHTARQDSTPLLMFTGHVNSWSKGSEAFQEIDQHLFFGSVAKAVLEPEGVGDISHITAEAVTLATSGRPGPVVVQLPRDVTSDDTEDTIVSPQTPTARTPDAAAIAEAARLIDAAERPLAIAGEMIVNQDASPALAVLVEKAGLPVMAAYRRQDALANANGAYAGHLEINRPDWQIAAIAEADLVIAVGSRLDAITTADNTALPEAAALIHIYPDAQVLARFSGRPAIEADMTPTLEALTDAVGPAPPARRQRQEELHQRFLAFSQPGNFPVHGDVDMAQVVDTTTRHLDAQAKSGAASGATFVTDAGSMARWVNRYRRFDTPRSTAGPMSGAMGYAVPGAVGAQIARPDQTVVAWVGDGGFVMTGQEMITAVEQGLPIKVVVCDNAAHGSIMQGQRNAFGEGAEFATALTSPDFAAVGAAYGAKAFRVAATDEFVPAFREALAHDGPALIHLLTDRRDIVPFGNEQEAV